MGFQKFGVSLSYFAEIAHFWSRIVLALDLTVSFPGALGFWISFGFSQFLGDRSGEEKGVITADLSVLGVLVLRSWSIGSDSWHCVGVCFGI